MKRNLLLLAVMMAVMFGFYSISAAQCPEQPNDNGVCDTLYLECCPEDCPFNCQDVPHQVRVVGLVTHDVPDPAIDSIAAFVIPLCFYCTNPAAQCTIDPFYNNTDLYPFPTTDRSIFRHPCDDFGDNWMMALSEQLMGLEWDTRILSLEDQHFWLALFPTGSADQRFGAGSRVPLFMITFDVMDSTSICIDSCFWPPASRLAFSRADAVTYIPRIWDDYMGEEYFCCACTCIRNQPPVCDTVPDDESHHMNGTYTSGRFTNRDPDVDGQVVAVSVFLTGNCAGIANPVVNLDPPGVPSKVVSGTVTYDVVNHCEPGCCNVCIVCTDNMGAKDTCCFHVDLTNTPPGVDAGDDVVGPRCFDPLLSDVIVTSDADNDPVAWALAGVSPTPFGSIVKDGDRVSFDPECADVCITYTVTVEATDICGATSTDEFTFHATNDPPVITENPADQSVSRGDQWTSTDFAGFDPEGHPVTWDVIVAWDSPNDPTNDPYVVGNTVIWDSDPADALGEYKFCMVIIDDCDLADTCCFIITLVFKQDYIEIGNYDCANPGEYVSLPVYLINSTVPFGGFELEFEFDYTSMCFVDVDPGDCFPDTVTDQDGFFYSWEYFTYRLLPCPIPPCQKYKVLVYGQAEIPNGHMNLGACIPAGSNCVLLYLNFVVMNNENLRGFKIPVCFEWEGTVVQGVIVEDWECTENTFASCDGNTLYTSSLLCEFNPDVCDDPGGAIEQILTFQAPFCGINCGGVDVCDFSGEHCKRGDVNMNTVSYEVADAVLFANYFVYGTPVFIHDLAYQICATDVNADGRALTLSDLIYLIRVILHDAVAIPKLAPASEVANVIVANNTITIDCAAPVAAMLFEFDGAIQPTLLADMEMAHEGNKVLVWSRNGNTITTVEVMSFTGETELVSVSAVDYDTRMLETNITFKAAPATFALHPAYPNPFNPFTNLSFTLPEAVSYRLNVYNVAGQLVRSYESVGIAGMNVVRWDGKDNAGNDVSSGVYFYKLIAGSFSATQKMVMMK
jgi:hypothetical protein